MLLRKVKIVCKIVTWHYILSDDSPRSAGWTIDQGTASILDGDQSMSVVYKVVWFKVCLMNSSTNPSIYTHMLFYSLKVLYYGRLSCYNAPLVPSND